MNAFSVMILLLIAVTITVTVPGASAQAYSSTPTSTTTSTQSFDGDFIVINDSTTFDNTKSFDSDQPTQPVKHFELYKILELIDDIFSNFYDDITALQTRVDHNAAKITSLESRETTLEKSVNDYPWVVTSYEKLEGSPTPTHYMDIVVKNVWPGQRIYATPIWDDGEFGPRYTHFSNATGVAINSFRVDYLEPGCTTFAIAADIQPFYTYHTHCLD